MSCKFFNAKEWKEVVEKLPEDPGIVHCDEVRISHFENINLDRSMILCLPKTSENNPFDGFKWTRSENGRRIQPIYRKYRINDSSYQGLHCTESKIAFLRKDILHYETKTYLHYFLSDVELFELPSANELTKPRVSGSVSIDLKENILPQRTTSAAYEIAKQKGYQVSRKQINNLRRGRTDVIVGKSGRRAVTTLHHIEILEKNFPQNLTYFIDHNNELVYGFVKMFEDGIRIFTASCPNEIEFEEWTCFVKEVEEDDSETRRQKIKEKLKHHPSGLIFPSRVYVDTTFNLTDAYVTLILGETNSFQTKTSGKPRIIPLGYLLHSHKNETHHQFFADCLKEVVEPYLIDKKVPCVMMDGEPALNVYAEALSSNVVRCDWHILRGLSLKHRQKAAKQACRVLFGYKDTNHKWKCGLFGSFTEEQFERRLLKVKNLVDSRIFTWLEKNKRWLMTTSTAIAKLRSGLILQYATTNSSENFNQQLKGVFRKPFSAEILIKKLDDFCNEKLFELIKSAIGESEYVVTKEDYTRLSFDERETEFRKIGLQCARLLAYDPPRNLL